MLIVDVHNHFYPPEYIEEVRRGSSHITVTTDDEGNPVLHSPGDRNFIVRGHRDITYRRTVLAAAGVDVQLLSFTAPGTLLEPEDRSVQLAALVNDALARLVRAHAPRFAALATLPLNSPGAALQEFRRATDELGLPGAMLFGNVNGVPLADERFWPLYEAANDRRAILYIHPTYPLGVDAMREYWLMPLVGFLFDTTLAAAHLVFAGVMERFPEIRWVLAHLGGAIPYLAERLDRGWKAFPECRRHISEPPSVYLRRLYYDTVNFDPRALQLAVEFAGAEQILAGSDYPHRIGSLDRMRQSLDELRVTPAEREAILGKNAARLLGLTTG